jgi:hypothetical protein
MLIGLTAQAYMPKSKTEYTLTRRKQGLMNFFRNINLIIRKARNEETPAFTTGISFIRIETLMRSLRLCNFAVFRKILLFLAVLLLNSHCGVRRVGQTSKSQHSFQDASNRSHQCVMRANPHAGCWGEGRICSQIKSMNHACVDGMGLPSCGLHKLDWHGKRYQKAVSDSGSEFTDVRFLSEQKKSSVKFQIYANYFIMVLTWLILRVSDFVDVLYVRYFQ